MTLRALASPTKGKASATNAREAHPFLKWVGGKGKLLPRLQSLAPKPYARYLEPFLGGGAFFFSLAPHDAVLADVNDELIGCYIAIRDDVDAVVRALRRHHYESAHYYAIRELNPATLPLDERAARTIFLNRAGFNGLFRVNRSGRFNVPFGRYTNPTICDEPNLRACSQVLRGVELKNADFECVAASASVGDFVYFDPPYVPVSQTANFTSYAAGRFTLADQARLARVFDDLVSRGVHALLSNSDTPLVRELYARHEIVSVQVTRSVNSDPAKRGPVGEVIVRGVPRRVRASRGSAAKPRHPERLPDSSVRSRA